MAPTTTPTTQPLMQSSSSIIPMVQKQAISSSTHFSNTLPSIVPSQVVPSSVVPLHVVPSRQKPHPLEKTIIRRHIIGKSKKSRHVGVLIKNVSTRKMISEEYKKLKKVNINEVKNQLKNNGLLKVGTTAPAEILRQTYEASILAGLVKNESEGTIIYNFMNESNEEKK